VGNKSRVTQLTLQQIWQNANTVIISEVVRLIKPPYGSKISISKIDDKFEIFLPSKKFSVSDIYPVAFSIFYIIILIFWTLGAMKTGSFLAFFSIPFWIVWIQLILGMVNSFDEDQIFTINKDGIELLINRPINRKEYLMKYSEIYFIKMGGFRINNPFALVNNFRLIGSKFNIAGLQVPTINTGIKTIKFFELASDAEQEWIVRFLNAILRKKNNSINLLG
jgi:hypothetical protein